MHIVSPLEAEQWLSARLEEQGGQAVLISRAEFAHLLALAPALIQFRANVAGAGAITGFHPTFNDKPLSYA